jgi:GTP-binding protein
MDQVFADYENIRKELELFSELLGEKEEIVVFSKADLLDDEMREFILSEFKSKYPNKKVFIISAASGQGIEELKDFLIDNYSRESILEDTEEKVSELKVYDLKKNIDPKQVDITYLGDLRFEAKGLRIEEIVRMSDFTNIEAVMRVYDVLEKMGIMKRLEELLKKVLNEEEMNTDFFFEGSEDKEIQPKVMIVGKSVPLDRLKYNL